MQSGYREGIDAGKAQTVQEGFNEGRDMGIEVPITATLFACHAKRSSRWYHANVAASAGFREGAAEGRAHGHQKGMQQTMQADGSNAKRA